MEKERLRQRQAEYHDTKPCIIKLYTKIKVMEIHSPRRIIGRIT